MKLFGTAKKKPVSKKDPSESIQQVKQAQKRLELRLKHMIDERDSALRSAQAAHKKKDKAGTLHHMKRKKLLDKQIDSLYQQNFNLTMTVDALAQAQQNQDAIKTMDGVRGALSEAINEDDLERAQEMMDEISEKMQINTELTEALSRPLGNDLMDEDELMRELQEVNDEMLEESMAEVPAIPVHQDGRIKDIPAVPAGVPKAKNKVASQEDELAALNEIMNA